MDAHPAFALGVDGPLRCQGFAEERGLSARLEQSVCGLLGPRTNIPFLVSVRFPYGALGRVSRVSEKWLILAEREGFEPSKGF